MENESSTSPAALTGAGNVTNSGGSAAVLTVANAADATFDGIIADGASTTALVKNSGGTLTLTNANTFTGGTSISAGVLRVIDGAGNTNADAALGVATAGVAIENGATLQAGGDLATTLRTITLGTGGGIIDTNGSTVNLGAGSAVTGTALTKSGTGTLRVAGTQTYATLTASAGTTNLKSALGTGASTLNADAIVNIGTSQTLAAINIGAGGVATLDSALPSPAPEFGEAGGFASAVGDAASVAAVPEPGSLSLLLLGIPVLLRRSVRKTCLTK